MSKEKQQSNTGKTAPPTTVQYQRSMLPIEIIDLHQNDLNSADMKLIGEGRNSKFYAVKTTNEGNGRIPAAEMFCYELAYRILIPRPNYEIILLPSKELAFGSEWAGGVYNGQPMLNYGEFIIEILQGKRKTNNLPRFLSRLYAFDLFINNVDRHWGNILWSDTYGGHLMAQAYDFSRASFALSYEGYDVLTSVNTQGNYFAWLNITKNYSRPDAVSCLNDIQAVCTDEVKSMFDNMPANWITREEVKKFLDWWDSSARIDRINKLLSHV